MKIKIACLLAPLLFTPALFFLIAEDLISLGAGDKDLFILIPWLVWATAFLSAGLLLLKKPLTFKHWLLKSLLYSTLFFTSAWASLFVYSFVQS